jgi:hypothetical protein
MRPAPKDKERKNRPRVLWEGRQAERGVGWMPSQSRLQRSRRPAIFTHEPAGRFFETLAHRLQHGRLEPDAGTTSQA